MNKKKIIIGVVAAIIIVLAGIVIYNAMSGGRGQTESNAPTDNRGQVTDNSENSDEAVKDGQSAASDNKPSDNSGNSDEAVKDGQSAASDNKPSDNSETGADEQKVYSPTFMYFVSNSDADFDKTAAVIDELKKEYGDRVTFDINNIDEKPEMKENFPVEGQTPALIMLNKSNDISAFEFKCSDKAKLAECIENALK